MIDPKKIAVIPLGVGDQYMPVKDTDLLARIRKDLGLPDKYVLYLGNFKPHKNVESLIGAFRKIAGGFPEYKLVLAGPLDGHGRRIQDLVSKQGLMGRVVFTGIIREKDHPEALLSMADLFVFPTLYEGFGLPPLEAMACGTPVITSNLTAVPEVIGVNEMGKAIADLLQDPEKRVKYSLKGLERSRIFSEDKTSGRIYWHIITLLEGIE
ncbi:MAG: glycosyltransferase family 4 protein [Deltaproteobacteria bacterium]|nr:glycosyltransferase family 4 protein [Deltaproteobacteria bacterium]